MKQIASIPSVKFDDDKYVLDSSSTKSKLEFNQLPFSLTFGVVEEYVKNSLFFVSIFLFFFFEILFCKQEFIGWYDWRGRGIGFFTSDDNNEWI